MKVFLLLLAIAGATAAQETTDTLAPAPAPQALPLDTAPMGSPDSLSNAPPDSIAAPALTDSAAADSAARPAPKKRPPRRERRVSVDKDVDSLITYQGDVNQLKSPKKAFFMSFVLPGLGQYYARANWVRIGVPVTVELSSYISLFVIRSKYNDLVDKYEKYADGHFDPLKLLAWQDFIYRDTSVDTSGTPFISWQDSFFTHRSEFIKSYPKKTSDYYEMIGKYDEFTQGWDDADPDMVRNNFEYIYNQNWPEISDDQHFRGFAIQGFVTNSDGTITDTLYLRYHDPPKNIRPFYFGHSQHQLDYVNLRNDANDMGDYALLAFYAMLINRMVSAVDAALAATAYNRRITGGTLSSLDRLRLEPSRAPRFPYFTNGLSVTYRF